MDQGSWKISEWEDTDKKDIGYCAIDLKKGFVPRKMKIYLLFREKREEVREFIQEQIRKGYIQLSKSLQMVPIFVGKKDGKKKKVQDY